MAVVSIMTTFLLLLGLTELTTVSPIVQFLIALIGLGVAIDYSLIVVSRWREERSHGRSGDEAVQRAMETAGRAVVFSGITVAIGLLALIALPLPFLRSMGYGGHADPARLDPGRDHAAARSCWRSSAPRLDWPHRRTDDKASRAWTRWAEAVARRRWLAAGAGMAVDPGAGVRRHRPPARHLRRQHRSPSRATRRTGLVALEDAGIGEGSLLPHEILIEGGTDPGAGRGRPAQGRRASTAPSRPTTPPGAATAPRSSRRSRSRTAAPTRARPRSRRCATPRTLPGPTSASAASPAANDDFIDAVYGSFPLMIALITITTFILLARAFRSLLLPLKAIVLNILSVAAAWGVLVLGLAARLRLGG